MKLTIDTEAGTLKLAEPEARELALYSPEAFHELSHLWMKVGWALKYSYRFTWMGRPIIQLPEDMVRLQELLYTLRPDVLVETGIAQGGSLVFYASLFKALGHGRVVGVDVEIRPHNRAAIEAHPLKPLIELIEGDSVAPATLARVRELLRPGERVLVMLDSNHTRAHVLAELRAYAPFVTPGSYLLVADGVMQDLYDVPGGSPEWREDNPITAIAEFLVEAPGFTRVELPPPFSESPLTERITYWPGGCLLRRAD
jgi:cephalosporin hydroxylase